MTHHNDDGARHDADVHDDTAHDTAAHDVAAHDVSNDIVSPDHDHPVLPDDPPVMPQSEAFDPNNVEDVLKLAGDHFMRDDDDDHDNDDEHDPDDRSTRPPKTSSQAVARWIISTRLKEALKPIGCNRPYCLLVEVPDAGWSEPIGNAIADMFCPRSPLRHKRDLTITTDDLPRHGNNDRLKEKALNVLSRGDPLVIVLNQPAKHLPPEIFGLVDDHVVVRPLDNNDLCNIIGELTRTSLVTSPDDIATGLSFEQIVGAIRLRDNPTSMLRRLRTLRQTTGRTRSTAVAPLTELVGYGDASAWGLRLSREIDRYRAGEITLADLPRGLLLSGPPGCGKTLFAQSLAVTCKIPIVATSVAAWLQRGDGHLGDVMLAVKKVFDEAHEKQKPAILFLDECDAFIDPNKARDVSHWWQTLRAGVLSAIDGAATEPGLIVLGACNYPELVDSALRRSGRLDRHIPILPPDATALASMLEAALGAELPDLDFARFGQLKIGVTGADVARYVREIRARARDHERGVTIDDIDAVLSPPDARTPELIRRITVHEDGHAVVAAALGKTVSAISLNHMGRQGGACIIASRPLFHTRASIDEEVMIVLAGRAAEICTGLEASSGASADLVEATRLLVRAHANFGLGMSLRSVGEDADIDRLLAFDEGLRKLVDNDLDRLWRRTVALIEANIDAIRPVASVLVYRCHLACDAIHEIIANAGLKASARSNTRALRNEAHQ
jgi:cell division protease FtsH